MTIDNYKLWLFKHGTKQCDSQTATVACSETKLIHMGKHPRNKLKASFFKCVHPVPQVIQLSSPHFLPVQDLDFFDVWRVTEQKGENRIKKIVQTNSL